MWQDHFDAWGPGAVLGVAVPTVVVLARTEETAIWITDLLAYPTGVSFTLVRMTRRDAGLWRVCEAEEAWFDGNERELVPEVLRFGVVFSDDREADNLNVDGAPRASELPRPVLVAGDPSGSGSSWHQHCWISPLPPPGPVAFVCEWPAMGIPRTRVEIDAALIRDAAQGAIEVWREHELWREDELVDSADADVATAGGEDAVTPGALADLASEAADGAAGHASSSDERGALGVGWEDELGAPLLSWEAGEADEGVDESGLYGPPEAIIGAPVSVARLLAKTDDVAIGVTNVLAFPMGFRVAVEVLSRGSLGLLNDPERLPPLEVLGQHDEYTLGVAKMEWASLRIEVEFSGLPDLSEIPTAADASAPFRPVVVRRNGNHWICPLPPAGSVVAISCEWPAKGIHKRHVELDGGAIRDAARFAVEVWAAKTPPA